VEGSKPKEASAGWNERDGGGGSGEKKRGAPKKDERVQANQPGGRTHKRDEAA
jgi:hypothetical protein